MAGERSLKQGMTTTVLPGLVISNSISTHLFWLQQDQQHKKYDRQTLNEVL